MDIEAEQRARLAAEMYASHIEETREMNARHLAEMRKHERRGIRFANFGLALSLAGVVLMSLAANVMLTAKEPPKVEAACQTS